MLTRRLARNPGGLQLIRLACTATCALPLTLGCFRGAGTSATPADAAASTQPVPVQLGVSINEPKAFPGYTLIAPIRSTTTYLIDMEGRVVRTWQSDTTPALGAYLLENGHLLRSGLVPSLSGSNGPGAGGRIQEFTWEGELVWDYQFPRANQSPHHDILRLPTGNILMIADEKKTPHEAIAAGRRPDLMQTKFIYPDTILEIKPTGKTTGDIVWEWHVWNHLVQEHNPSRANYGPVAEHPELLDINYYRDLIATVAATKAGIDKLRSLGYMGSGTDAHPHKVTGNWSHLNALDYNAALDQIMVTSFSFGEFWIIDHSTTTAEAVGHTGGKSGKGGDLLYRWGNPSAYLLGLEGQQRLFLAHHAHWIPPGLAGAGRALVFNNGKDRPDGSYSSVDEVVLPVDAQGRYVRGATRGADATPLAFGPDKPIWSYHAPNKSDLYSFLLSGVQRLPNGNTLICSGCNGTLLEVTREGEVVWKYVNPVQGVYIPTRWYPSGPEGFGPPGGGSLFRAYRYGRDYPGLAGKDLTPGETIEASLPKT